MAASKQANVMTVRRKECFREVNTNGTHTDFSIIVNRQRIACHKMVLSSASPFFQGLLQHDMIENQRSEVKLDSLDIQAVRDLVGYCYNGELEVSMDHVKQYLEAAHFLQLEALYTHFDEFIADNLEVGNCIGFMFYGDRYKLKKTERKAKEMIIAKFQVVSMLGEFMDLTFIEVKDIVTQGQASGLLGDVLLQACFNWIMDDDEQRKQHVDAMLQAINMTTCCVHFLKKLLREQKDSLLSEKSSYVRVTEALMAVYEIQEQKEEEAKKRKEKKKGRKIMLYGGRRDDGVRIDKVWTVDLQSARCEEILSPVTKYLSAICATSHGLMVAGGGTSRDFHGTEARNCDLLDYSTLRWIRYPDTLSNVFGAGSVCIQEVVYLLGGYRGREKTLESFTLQRQPWTTLKQWKRLPNMLHGMRLPIVASIGHYILVLCNTHPHNKLFSYRITLQCYNTISNHWGLKSSPPSIIRSTDGAQAVGANKTMFVVGGEGKLCCQYDLQSDNWSTLSRPLEQHCYGSVVNLEGKIVVLGGEHNCMSSNTVEEYDPECGKWRVSSTKLPQAVFYHFCCVMK